MSESIINLTNVKKEISSHQIIKDATFSIQKGSVNGLVGLNGSGKSVLFKLICGLYTATQGEIIVDNLKIGKDIDFPNSIGIFIENPGYIPEYSGYKNLKILASIKNEISDKEISDTMNKLGLDPMNKTPVAKYSLGMKQKLGIAQAIMENPEIIILDEPMNSLDEDSVTLVRNIINELRKSKKTILMTSHNKSDIDILCDTVYEIKNGIVSQISKNDNLI